MQMLEMCGARIHQSLLLPNRRVGLASTLLRSPRRRPGSNGWLPNKQAQLQQNLLLWQHHRLMAYRVLFGRWALLQPSLWHALLPSMLLVLILLNVFVVLLMLI